MMFFEPQELQQLLLQRKGAISMQSKHPPPPVNRVAKETSHPKPKAKQILKRQQVQLLRTSTIVQHAILSSKGNRKPQH